MFKLRQISYIYILLIFILIGRSNINVNANELNKSNINVDISYVDKSDIKVGRYLPIKLNIDNKGESLKSKFKIDVYSDNTETHSYIYNLDIKSNEILSKDYIIYLEKETYFLNISLLDEKDKVFFEEEIKLATGYNSSNLIIGVLSDTPEKLKFFEGVSLNYGLLKTKLLEMNLKTFPVESKYLEQIDAILISNYRIKDLSYEQSRALMDFVKNGGIMIMGTGLRASDTIGRYAPELLDEMYGESYIKTIKIKDSDKNIIEKDINVVDLEIHGGNEIISEDTLPLITSVNKENGKIIVSAFDFTELSPELSSTSEFISTMLTKAIGFKILEKLTTKTAYESNHEYFRVKELLSVPSFFKFPKLNIYFLLIIVYLILTYPLSFIILKYYNLSSIYLKFIFINSLIFIFIVYILTASTRFKNSFYKYISINSINEDYISKNIFIKLSNPYNKAYNFNLDNDYYYKPLDEIYVYDNDKKDKVIIEKKDENLNIEYSKNKAFETHIFELEKKEENIKKMYLDTYINVFKDEVSGYIENNYNFDLEDVNIFLYSKLVHIGNLKAGERLDLKGKKIINIPLGNSFMLAYYLNPYYNSYSFDYGDKKSMSEFERINLMLFYIDNFSGTYTQDAKILAFAKEEKNLNIIKDAKGDGVSLYVTNVNVDNSNGEYIYRQALLKDPTIISGEYYVETNTYYTLAPLVLDYNLGDDVEVEELIFENINTNSDDKFELFKGDIYLYNNINKTFDKKDKNKSTYTKEELEKYLTFDNTIRIRYFNNNFDSSDIYKSISLPMLSIVAGRR